MKPRPIYAVQSDQISVDGPNREARHWSSDQTWTPQSWAKLKGPCCSIYGDGRVVAYFSHGGRIHQRTCTLRILTSNPN